jgi:hypothetical protein
MHDFLLHVLLSVVSFLIGASLTRVWDRARPFLVLQGFSELLSEEAVDCPRDLVQLTDESWVTPALEEGKNPLNHIRQCYDLARTVATTYENSLAKLPLLIERLQVAQKPSDVLSTLREVMMDDGLRDALDNSLRLQEIELGVVPRFDGPEILQIAETASAYRITWQKNFSLFSSRLDEFPELKFRLSPFVEAMRHLHQPTILSALHGIRSGMDRQIKIHLKLQALAQKIVDEYGGWSADLLVVNYGATPMIVWKEAELVVTHKKTKYRIVCRPQVLEDQSWRFLEGPRALSPGQELRLRLCTAVQSKIEDGRLLRTHNTAVEDKDKAQGQIWLKVTRRGAFGSRVASDTSDFGGGMS